jgi:DNA topoisomerase-1
MELLERGQQVEEPLGVCPQTHKPVFIKQGRFGPYVQLGLSDDDDKKNASLLRGMEASEVDLATALQLLALPRTLGPHPTTQEPVVVSNGRYGPYVKCGSETRSLPVDVSPLTVNLETSLGLLAQPKSGGRRRTAAKEPLREFPESPVTGQPIKLLDGRYGPYVTDGTTNASLPKGATPDDLTVEQALALLAERAGRGVTKRAVGKKKAVPKKKVTAQKTPRKTGAKKSS